MMADAYKVPHLCIRIVSNNITNGGRYDAGTAQSCQGFVLEVVRAHIRSIHLTSTEVRRLVLQHEASGMLHPSQPAALLQQSCTVAPDGAVVSPLHTEHNPGFQHNSGSGDAWASCSTEQSAQVPEGTWVRNREVRCC